MPDFRRHHGPGPRDGELFAASVWPRLQEGVRDLSWLLTRGYAQRSGLKIVGDRYALDQRQRAAVARSSCSDSALASRLARLVPPEKIAGSVLLIDGFNLLTTVEVALAGGVIPAARDGCVRDIAGVHGTYRKVEETRPAILLCGRTLAGLGPAEAVWFLDSPVGNSGRLKAILLQTAREQGWPWQAELVPNPDRVLIESGQVIATADSAVLDRCQGWLNLAREVVSRMEGAFVVPMVGNSVHHGVTENTEGFTAETRRSRRREREEG